MNNGAELTEEYSIDLWPRDNEGMLTVLVLRESGDIVFNVMSEEFQSDTSSKVVCPSKSRERVV